jgi:hypothetical protein
MARTLTLILIFLLSACKGSNVDTPNTSDSGTNSPDADYAVLMFGNSHTALHNLPAVLARLIELGTGKSATVVKGPGNDFLNDRSTTGSSFTSLSSRQWSHVVLQGQKYSQSHTVTYSTTKAEEWVRLVRDNDALPVMYPEHPQRGVTLEVEFLHELYSGIARRAGACVAPISHAWGMAVEDFPHNYLYSADGNHFNGRGAFFTAMILFSVITQSSAQALPFVEDVDVNADDQARMREYVDAVMASYPPCQYI